ncbi:MAG: protein kinase [Alcanivorax sp.]|nr:protein kinase [Alcanivorax sp.]MBI55738.1 protein kinase [Alcanivorax sp.]HCE40034.1 protein kinase [Alcanivorax sp.]|tara:strand:- start:21496 stop:23154 length:1659 start_codon:yes stop_codon:yes gene_type:complete
MTALRVRAGQASHAGPRPHNADAVALRVPADDPAALRTKGVAAALADGLSSAAAGREAAESCVLGFLNDYYATPSLWSVPRSAQRVLEALNRWLYRQTRAGDAHLCTLSVLVLRGGRAHLFQVGDSRIWRLREGRLECLTRDHQRALGGTRVLTRAMGADPRLEVDYVSNGLRAGDRFLLTSDGLHDALATEELAQGMVGPEAPALLAERLIEAGRRLGARDNLSCQLLCVDSPGSADLDDRRAALDERPLPPPLSPGMELDGLTVERELHASPRSQLYRVRDGDGRTGVIKAPSVNLEDDAEALQRFALEGWLLARLRGPHFPRPLTPPRPPSCQYLYLEYIDGVTLDQWAREHPDAPVEERLYLADQLFNGLRALHRADVLHDDLKPDNLMVDRHGVVKLIDLGNAHPRGGDRPGSPHPQGTRPYTAPERARGEAPSERADQFAAAAVIHEMLTGILPWRGHYRRAAGRPLPPMTRLNPFVPEGVERALARALSARPEDRFHDVAELRAALRRPGPVPRAAGDDPQARIRLWRGISVVLLVLLLTVLAVK